MFVWNNMHAAAAAAKSLQSCLILCNPINGSPPGSPVPGILQARTLEWVAMSFSNAWKWKVKVKSLSHVRLFETPWTAAHQAPPSMGFSRQEYWSGVPSPSPGIICIIIIIINCYNKNTYHFINHLFLHLRPSHWDHFLSWSISFRSFFNQYRLVVRTFCCFLCW